MTPLDPPDIALPERRANRPVTLAHRMERAGLGALFAVFRLIGVDASSAIAGAFCRTVGPLIGPVSQRGRTNMRAIHPDWSRDQVERTLRGVWENLGRTVAEFAHLEAFTGAEASERLQVEGLDGVKAAIAEHGAVIFVAGHFANWELMSIVAHQAGVDHAIVYRAANNPLVDEMIIRERAKVMPRRQIPKGKRGARALVDTLKSGRSLGMLVDQKLNDGIEAPFMGRPAMTAPTPARLALKFGVPIIPVQVVRRKGARFSVTYGAPLAFEPTGGDGDVLALTTLINETLAADINAHPDQWLWLHRRWPLDARSQ